MTSGSAFGILGCVEVVGPHGPVGPLGARHRALVAALALQPGVVVPCWRLVEALWGERPPRTALRSLHSHVARLRLLLEGCGLGGVLQTREPGYVLAVDPQTVDASRFEREVRLVRDSLAAGSIAEAAESLNAALSRWRGAALADAEPSGWMAAEAIRLENLRVTARADRCEAALLLGRHDEALAEAEKLLNADPMRERLVGLHMIALWGGGRPAEALAVYQRLRAALADELGVDPSRELTDLHTAMLRGATIAELRAPGSVAGQSTVTMATAQRPTGLPSPVGYFTGREAEQQLLDGVVARSGRDAPLVALICGHGGIGKTSLAVQWAHRVADRFPDGQVFVDAHGSDSTTALSAAKVAAVLLRCLGVPGDRMPNELDERIGLYRSLLAGRRMLIVLDNVRSTDQVAPVIPSSAGSLLLVTSRSSLAALVTHVEVSSIVLDMLSRNESAELLAKVLGAQRVDREPQAAARLAELCCRMPLALRIAAAKLVTQPGRSIESLAAEVSGDDRLTHLRVEDGIRTVEAVFASAYQALSAPTRRLFRRLGLHPGPHVAAPLAAAVSSLAADELESALAELVAAHLITEIRPGRYRFHDLIRLFAQRCALTEEPDEARQEVMDRLLDWYLVVAHSSNQVLDKSRDRLVPTFRRAAPAAPFPDVQEQVFAFLESERENLLAVVRHAADHGEPVAACQLTYLLSSFFSSRFHWPERIETGQHAVRAARSFGDPRIEAEMHRALGAAYRTTYQLDQALESFLRALPLLRALGDERGLAYLYNNIGGAYAELRRFEEAVEAYQMSLHLHTSTENRFGAVAAQRNLGYVCIRMNQADRSLAHLEEALATSRAIGYRRLEAAALDSLGEAHLRRGEYEQALECFSDALTVSRDIGNLRYEMDALANLGLTYLACGSARQAVDFFGQALAVSRVIAHRHAQARILNHLGEAHLQLNDGDAASRFLHAAAQLRESVPDLYEEACLQRNLGDLAQLTGQREIAVGHWERAIGMFRKANASSEADFLAERVSPDRPASAGPAQDSSRLRDQDTAM